MEIKAQAKHIRMSPRKLRLVVDIVRGSDVTKALDQLGFVNKKATGPIEKLIKSAIANGEHNYELDKSNLYIKEIKVDEGRTLRRWKPRAHGRATPIRKRSSHISLVLGEVKDSGKKKAKKEEIAAPVNLDEMAKKAKKEEKKSEEKEDKQEEKASTEKKETLLRSEEEKKALAKSKRGFASKLFRRKSG